MGGLSTPYATTPMNNSTGITIGGTRYFMAFPVSKKTGSAASAVARARLAPDHNMLERTTAPRAMPASSIIARQYFSCPAPARSRRCKGTVFCAGKSSTNRRLMAKSSNDCVRRMGNRAIKVASASAARAFGKGVSRAASSQGSTPSRVNAETTLSVTPFCSSPTEAKRKSFRSEWSRENRAGSAMNSPGLKWLPPAAREADATPREDRPVVLRKR
jgi:hypothetical protein